MSGSELSNDRSPDWAEGTGSSLNGEVSQSRIVPALVSKATSAATNVDTTTARPAHVSSSFQTPVLGPTFRGYSRCEQTTVSVRLLSVPGKWARCESPNGSDETGAAVSRGHEGPPGVVTSPALGRVLPHGRVERHQLVELVLSQPS